MPYRTPTEIRDLIHARAVDLVVAEHPDDEDRVDELDEIYALTDAQCHALDAPTDAAVWANFRATWGHPLEFCRQ